jgi:hypothetical protein
MPASPVLRDVFSAHRAAFGEEDHGYLFEHGPPPIDRLDVLVYRPAGNLDLTTFTTIGMATAPDPGGNRSELQFSRRGRLNADDESAVAGQLANLAVHPFSTGASFGWGQLIGLGHDFPTFPGRPAVFLSGPLTNTGRDYLATSEGQVRVINVIPVSEAERAHARTLPPIEFIQRLMAQRDVLA